MLSLKGCDKAHPQKIYGFLPFEVFFFKDKYLYQRGYPDLCFVWDVNHQRQGVEGSGLDLCTCIKKRKTSGKPVT